ncbi:MAG: hypothetical protein ACE5K4_10965 [Candidatus Hydrothermarchaeota archaeon]
MVRLTKKRKEKIIKALKKKGFSDPASFDLESYWDNSLSFSENFNNIVGKFVEYQKDEQEYLEQQANLLEQEYVKEQFEKAIKKIKVSSPELDKYFRQVKELVKITVKGNNNGLILISNGGLGKTFTVLSTLNELGLRINQDYIYLNSYITALELYHLLYSNKDKIIFLDDVEKILDDLTKISLLKACLWESAKDIRMVSYYSSTEKLKAPLNFEFNGKIILCLNKIPSKNKEIIESLFSRALVYRLNFSYDELIKIFYELAKVLKIDLKIVDFIRKNTTEATENLNFRTLIQSSIIYEYYKNYPDVLNGQAWKEIIKDILIKNTNPLKIVLELMESNLSIKEQISRFITETGYSRRTFFRIKRAIKNNSSIDWS